MHGIFFPIQMIIGHRRMDKTAFSNLARYLFLNAGSMGGGGGWREGV